MSWPFWFLLCIVPAVVGIVAAYWTGQAQAMTREMEAREGRTSKGAEALMFFGPLLVGGVIGFHAAMVVPAVMTLGGTPGIRTVCFLMPSCTSRAEYLRTANPAKTRSKDRARHVAATELVGDLHDYMRGRPGLGLGDKSLLKSLQWISAFAWAYAAILWALPLIRLATGIAALAAMLWVAWFLIKVLWAVLLSLF